MAQKLFIAEGGPECLKDNQDEIMQCFNSTFSHLLPKEAAVKQEEAPLFQLGEKECRERRENGKAMLIKYAIKRNPVPRVVQLLSKRLLGIHYVHEYLLCKLNYRTYGSATYAFVCDMGVNPKLEALNTLYVLVRHILEYSSTVWKPYLVGHIDRLESIQNRFIRLIGLQLDFEYRNFNLEPLHSRRIVHDQLFLKKLICSVIDAPDLLELLGITSSSSTQAVCKVALQTQYMFHRAFPRLQCLANNLLKHLDFFNMSCDTLRENCD
ncbi:hypothetical protein J6590_070189 [Homalodisca vitripennis]|nr:hypothetical protein J6590_070189 [Homalodisca vitripennis]